MGETADNRRLRHHFLKDLTSNWEGLNKIAADHPDPRMAVIRRDGHCHEAVMWYVHHLTEDMKQILTETTDITIPLLSPSWHGHSCLEAKKLAEEGKETLDATFKKVCEHYQEQVTCASR